MTHTFTFPNTIVGAALRAGLVTVMLNQGRECREFEETWQDGKQVTTVLQLEVTKRPDEGQIAKAMKERQHGNR